MLLRDSSAAIGEFVWPLLLASPSKRALVWCIRQHDYIEPHSYELLTIFGHILELVFQLLSQKASKWQVLQKLQNNKKKCTFDHYNVHCVYLWVRHAYSISNCNRLSVRTVYLRQNSRHVLLSANCKSQRQTQPHSNPLTKVCTRISVSFGWLHTLSELLHDNKQPVIAPWVY